MKKTDSLEVLLGELSKIRSKIKTLRKQAAKRAVVEWRAKKRKTKSSLEELKKLLSYNPETGLFTWLVDRPSFAGKAKAGSVAGTLKTGKGGGYILIVVEQQNYRAHRLAWWFMTGDPAPNGIDVEHENRDRADNKWKNLRLATRSQNNCNSKIRVTNTSGAKGVHRVNNQTPGSKPWFARITINKKIIHLGCFDTVEEAAEARRQAEIQHHGEFRAK